MIPTAEYPRWRYVAMQVVLFAVLLATVGLAHWVSRRNRVPASAGPIVLGDFTLVLPADWDTTRKKTPAAIEITAIDPDESGRQIVAIFQQLAAPVSPQDYLLHSGLIGGEWKMEQMTVEGNPGAYLEMMRLINQDGSRLLAKDLMACVMLPSGQALTLQLTGPGRVQEEDQQIMQELLTKLQIKPQKHAAPEHPTQEWEGI